MAFFLYFFGQSKKNGHLKNKSENQIMKNVLLMLHPIMPYVTEEIFEKLFKSNKLAISSSWPSLIETETSLKNGIGLTIDIVSAIRSIRVEKNIPNK